MMKWLWIAIILVVGCRARPTLESIAELTEQATKDEKNRPDEVLGYIVQDSIEVAWSRAKSEMALIAEGGLKIDEDGRRIETRFNDADVTVIVRVIGHPSNAEPLLLVSAERAQFSDEQTARVVLERVTSVPVPGVPPDAPLTDSRLLNAVLADLLITRRASWGQALMQFKREEFPVGFVPQVSGLKFVSGPPWPESSSELVRIGMSTSGRRHPLTIYVSHPRVMGGTAYYYKVYRMGECLRFRYVGCIS